MLKNAIISYGGVDIPITKAMIQSVITARSRYQNQLDTMKRSLDSNVDIAVKRRKT